MLDEMYFFILSFIHSFSDPKHISDEKYEEKYATREKKSKRAAQKNMLFFLIYLALIYLEKKCGKTENVWSIGAYSMPSQAYI